MTLVASIVCALLWTVMPDTPRARAAQTPTPDRATTRINKAVTIDVLSNDPSGSSLVDYTDPGHGRISVTQDGELSYLPDANFLGVDIFAYRAQLDATIYDPVAVTIDVTGQVTSVEARDDDAATDEDVPILTYVLGNDGLGPAGAPLAIQVTAEPTHGVVEIQADGSVAYSPAAEWSGSDSYTYVASDGSTSDHATVAITVAPVADPPNAVDDAAITTQGSHASIEVFANDNEADGDGYALVEFAQPINGTVSWSDLDHMMIYVPNPEFWGVDQFTYTIGDIDGFDTALVTITVNGAPTPQDDVATTEQGHSVQIQVLDNDADPEGAGLIVSNAGPPGHGTTTINPDSTIQYTPDPDFVGQDSFSYTVIDEQGNASAAAVTMDVVTGGIQSTGAIDDEFLVMEDSPGNTLDILSNDRIPPTGSPVISIDSAPAHGTVTLDAMQLLTYVPDADFSGHDVFSYSITDGLNPPSTATVSVDIQAVNDAPVANPDTVMVDEDTELIIDATSNDTDPDGDALEIASVMDAANGTTRITKEGAVAYQPAQDFAGVDSFEYVVADGNGGTATSTVTITVNPVNDTPRAVDDAERVEIGGSALFDILANDNDPDGPQMLLTILVVPTHGTAALTADNTIHYLPDVDFEGYDSIEYQLSDGHLSATATITITVGNPNTAPRAQDDTVATTVEKPVVIDVLKNDKDADHDRMVMYGVTKPDHGTLAIDDERITYTPNPGFVGTDSFTYKVRDNHGGRDRATVSVEVAPAKDRRTDEK